MESINKPNFFIVGSPKCGSTSVYNYLKEHPEIFLPKLKEINYFSSKEIIKQNLYYHAPSIIKEEKKYLGYYKNKDFKILGDSSVSYLFYKNVPKRIYDFNPESKILILIRNPISRAHSHYLMDYNAGYINDSFQDIFYKNNHHHINRIAYQQIFELSLYYPQIERYIKIFGNKNVKIILIDDLIENLVKTINSIVDFLGVNSNHKFKKTGYNTYKIPKNKLINYFFKNNFTRKMIREILSDSIKNKLKSLLFTNAKKPQISNHFLSKLKDFYLDDIKNISNIIDRDLVSKWDLIHK